MVSYYQGVFDTYADWNNLNAQNCSYSIDFFRCDSEYDSSISKVLSDVFEYKGTSVKREISDALTFKQTLFSWLFTKDEYKKCALAGDEKDQLGETLFKNILKDFEITNFSKLNIHKSDKIEHFGQYIEIFILQSVTTMYLCVFMLDS